MVVGGKIVFTRLNGGKKGSAVRGKKKRSAVGGKKKKVGIVGS